MLEEVDDEADHKDGKAPFVVDLHNGKSETPFRWLVENEEAKDFEFNPIKFFFCAKHENSGKIESHLWFFKGF